MSAIVFKDANAAKKAAIEAAKAKARPQAEDGAIIKYVAPSETKDRIRIIFDDSGSMMSEIENAKDGVVEFLRNCVPNSTAVAVHFLCTHSEDASRLEQLATDLPSTALVLKNTHLSLGGTPLFTTMNRVVEQELTTRMVVFSDGGPTDNILPPESRNSPTDNVWFKNADVIIAKAIEKKIPIDTVFFGNGGYNKEEIALMKYFAEKTGGYFLHFDPKKVNFSTAFKYLAPVNRKMLASASFRAELEAGKKG